MNKFQKLCKILNTLPHIHIYAQANVYFTSPDDYQLIESDPSPDPLCLFLYNRILSFFQALISAVQPFNKLISEP